ncbi:MAG: hypothetical protein Q4B60_03100 [Erysipelotrichaceae bacterium]|nr:hypothetical protein [Erysipelotrichaceae bacterium]
MRAPDINSSSIEERENYIKEAYRCKGNCEICGLCAVLKGKSAEVVFDEYIKGEKAYFDIVKELR